MSHVSAFAYFSASSNPICAGSALPPPSSSSLPGFILYRGLKWPQYVAGLLNETKLAPLIFG